jgi:hypothetical protein
MRSAARRFGVSLLTVQRWVQRAERHRLDRVDWADQPRIPRHTRRTDTALEELVLTLRRELKETSDLGEFGAAAIHRALVDRAGASVPSVRTIGRILDRHGALDARRRTRRQPPPPGWYLPEVASRRAELDSFDVVEGLVIKDGPQVEVLNGVSLHGGLTASWPSTAITAHLTVEALIAHWRAFGLPTYAQFDNDTRFQGPHQHPDVIGRVMRLCLSLEVTPVFAPPRETGFQAAIESYNGRWQAKVWARFQHESLDALQAQSARYVAASRARASVRIEGAPPRRPFPEQWSLDLQAHPCGCVIFLRRTSESGTTSLLGHTFEIDPHWPHRLVRSEVDLQARVIRLYALRRHDPAHQRLLREVPYALPQRSFRE